ncbi:MAG: hypothetical protein JWO90_2482, partial [Solirubrobacterales bacterium]|nr:hypothetical protein [Solirubrobacterales bacterium]
AGRRARIWVRDLRTHRTTAVSTDAQGASTQPAPSGDGARVAFTATASVTGGKPSGPAGVYVRDLARGTTTSSPPAPRARRTGRAVRRAALGISVSREGLVRHLDALYRSRPARTSSRTPVSSRSTAPSVSR